MKVKQAKPNANEEAVRTVIRRYAEALPRVLLASKFHNMLDDDIATTLGILHFLRRGAKRKKPSKAYREFSQVLLAEVATAQFGPLSDLAANDLAALDQMMAAMVSILADGELRTEQLDPAGFVSLQKKLLIPLKKRGPRYRGSYDEAFERYVNGEDVTSIARKVEPEAFESDPVGTTQRYFNAFQRRQKKTGRGTSHST